MKILHLTLERKWFDLIAKGEKKTEYRDYKPHWQSRLIEDFDMEFLGLKSQSDPFVYKQFDEVWFYNGGYCDKNKFPFMRVRWMGVDIKDNKFNIHLGEILEIKNWSNDEKHT